MKDSWSVFNEVVQNVIALLIVGIYAALIIIGRPTPLELQAFVAAVLAFYGYKAAKNGKGNGG